MTLAPAQPRAVEKFGLALVDSHAHLGEPDFDLDRTEVLRRARQSGVEAVVVVGNDTESSRRAVQVADRVWAAAAEQLSLPPAPAATGSPEPADALSAGAAIPTAMLPSLYATAGIAPHHVDEVDDDALERVEALLALESVVAVGEIGLDYHYDLPRQAQRRLFGRQLEWALGRDLPVVVHSREAAEDVVAMLREYAGGDSAPDAGADRDAAPLRGVIHCFTESGKMAEEVIELGFYLSFAGILTFHNAAELRQTAARVPLEKMLIETDSPFLAPAPHRGHRNEPAYVGEVARALAELHGRPLQEVAAITAANARELFGLQT